MELDPLPYLKRLAGTDFWFTHSLFPCEKSLSFLETIYKAQLYLYKAVPLSLLTIFGEEAISFF